MERRGNSVVVGAVILTVGLLALGGFWFRERGAWLRTDSGRVYLCVEVMGNKVDRDVLFGLVAGVELVRDAERRSNPGFQCFEWDGGRCEPSTRFRPAYIQLRRSKKGPITPPDDLEALIRNFSGCLLRPEGSVTGYRLAWIDELGEVIRTHP